MKKFCFFLLLVFFAWPSFASVNTISGNLSYQQTLFSSPNDPLSLNLEITYNSRNWLNGELGKCWSHSYDIFLYETFDGSMVLSGGVGRHIYLPEGSGGYKPRTGDFSTLLKNADNTWTLTLRNGIKYQFNASLKLISIVDRYNNALVVDSSVPDQRTLTDPAGRSAVIHYNGDKIDWIKDPAQKQYDFSYNPTSGMLEIVTGPAPDASHGRPIWEYRYTAAEHFLEYIKDPEGHITKYGYSNEKVTRIVDPEGVVDMTGAESADAALHTKTYAYDFARGVAEVGATTITEKDGGKWVVRNDMDVLLSKEQPDGKRVEYTYYSNVANSDPRFMMEKTVTVPVNDTTRYVTEYVNYDGFGNPTEIKGYPRALILDGSGNLVSTIDGATDRHLLVAYDNYGRATATTDLIANMTTTTAYVVNNGKETLTITAPKINAADPSGPQTTQVFRSDGQLESVTDPLGRKIVFTYTSIVPRGLLETATDQTTGIVATYSDFDAFGRPKTVTVSKSGQDDRITKLVYDDLGRLKSNTKKNVVLTAGAAPVDLVNTFDYDQVGNLISFIDAENQPTAYEYNYRGQPKKITDALNQVTELLYNGTGCGSCGGGVDKLYGVKDANLHQTDFTYYPTGTLKSETDPLNHRLLYAYTDDGRLVQKLRDVNADGEIDPGDHLLLEYDYLPDGRIDQKSVRDENGVMQLTDFDYDTKGRLQRVSSPAITYTYTYYDNGWFKTVNDGTRTIEYLYDAAGRRDLVTIKQGTTTLQTLDYVYDAQKRLEKIITEIDATHPGNEEFIFGYDEWSRRYTLTYPNGVVATYGYNEQTDWLTGITYRDAGGVLLDFDYTEYNKVGNRKERREDGIVTEYTYDADHQLTQAKTGASEENFTYDPVGNRKSGPTVKDSETAAYEHDDANRMLEGRKFEYAYDDVGNRQYCYFDASHSKFWQYAWDAENRLVKAELKKGAQTLRTVTFKYDPFGRRIEKKLVDAAGTATRTYVYDGEDIALEIVNAGTTTTQARYVHGPGIDEPLALVQSGQAYYYQADGLGSIVALTDGSQAVVQRYGYESFGMLTVSDPEFENAYTYTGREWDKELGLYFYRARYYDPMEGRFISKDPIGFAGGDVNVYNYVGGNPVNYTDPSGRFGIGAVIGIGIGMVQGASGALAQNGSLGSILLSASLGGVEGAVLGFLDPTDGVLTIALASGLVGATSNYAGQLIAKSTEPCGENNTINVGSIIGAAIGSTIGGGMGSLTTSALISVGASEGIAAFGGAIGIAPGAMISNITGEFFK